MEVGQVAFVIGVLLSIATVSQVLFPNAVILLVSPHSLEIWFILTAFLLDPRFLQAFTLFLWQLDRISVLSINLREISLSLCFKTCSIKEHTPVVKKLGLGLMGDTILCHRYVFLLGLDLVLC